MIAKYDKYYMGKYQSTSVDMARKKIFGEASTEQLDDVVDAVTSYETFAEFVDAIDYNNDDYEMVFDDLKERALITGAMENT